MRTEFELYNSTWEEIESYCSSKYRRNLNEKQYLAEYVGRLNTDTRMGLHLVFDYVRVRIRISQNGKFRLLKYSANLFPLYLSFSLGLTFLFIIIHWASDSWIAFATSSFLGLYLFFYMRIIVKNRLRVQASLDRDAIIALRQRQSNFG